jgi:hypothetical protein
MVVHITFFNGHLHEEISMNKLENYNYKGFEPKICACCLLKTS